MTKILKTNCWILVALFMCYLVAPIACDHRKHVDKDSPVMSKRPTVPALKLKPTELEGKNMITSNHALEIAYCAIKDHLCYDKPGDIEVELKEDKYQVTISCILPDKADEKWKNHVVQVFVEAESQNVLTVQDAGAEPLDDEGPDEEKWKDFMSPKRAHEIALNAIKGFENYDKRGKLLIKLEEDKTKYYVTFPLILSPASGSRRADYAIQVRIDPISGNVLKKLVAS
jgi:hypothetical protein